MLEFGVRNLKYCGPFMTMPIICLTFRFVTSPPFLFYFFYVSIAMLVGGQDMVRLVMVVRI